MSVIEHDLGFVVHPSSEDLLIVVLDAHVEEAIVYIALEVDLHFQIIGPLYSLSLQSPEKAS